MSHHHQQVDQIKQIHAGQYQVTPIGLPLTPSMPPFNFLPPGPGSPSRTAPITNPNPNPYSPYPHPLPSPIHLSPLHHPHAHTLHALSSHTHALHPLQHAHHPHPAPFGITPLSPPSSASAPTFASSTSAAAAAFATFSPGATMSPGAFWGRPGHGPPPANPLINPAVGAPVHVDSNASVEPTGYFDGAWFVGSGGAGAGSVVESEILRGRDGGEDGGRKSNDGEVLRDSVGIERKVDEDAVDPRNVEEQKDNVDVEVNEKQVNGDEARTDTEEKQKQKQNIRPRPRRHSSTTTVPMPWPTPLPLVPKNEYHHHDDGGSEGAVDFNSELALFVKDGVHANAAVSRTHSMSSSKKPVELGSGLFSSSNGSSGNFGDGHIA